jgi:hypothetical protein
MFLAPGSDLPSHHRMDSMKHNMDKLSQGTESLEAKFRTVNEYLLEVLCAISSKRLFRPSILLPSVCEIAPNWLIVLVIWFYGIRYSSPHDRSQIELTIEQPSRCLSSLIFEYSHSGIILSPKGPWTIRGPLQPQTRHSP